MPETITRTGLLRRGGSGDAPEAVPLAGVSVDAAITGFCARVVVAQRCVTPSQRNRRAPQLHVPLDRPSSSSLSARVWCVDRPTARRR
jgi:hypothetical protein